MNFHQMPKEHKTVAQAIVARLNGQEIETRFSHYEGLVRNGLGGFIIFGGEMETVKECIKRLQSQSPLPLIISSDLEQGLGQQVRGGTLFPPARAVAEATLNEPALRKRVFRQMALEAQAAGINTVFAPVLDVDSNPQNPIISTRAFGPDVATVSACAQELIRAYEAQGIRSCGKHFPGHGDTAIDSHLGLPELGKSIKELDQLELVPFKAAVDACVPMIMLAHMSVPALDSVPTSISAKAVRLLRKDLGFKGIITTDALDMGALSAIGQERAAAMALEAGVDILLHPSDPGGLAQRLPESSPQNDGSRLIAFRQGLLPAPQGKIPTGGEDLALEVSRKAIRLEGKLHPLKKPSLVALSDEAIACEVLSNALGIKTITIRSEQELKAFYIKKKPEGDLILAVCSSIRAYKGGASPWLKEAIKRLSPDISIAFGPPALLEGTKSPARVTAWWAGGAAQMAVAELITDRLTNA